MSFQSISKSALKSFLESSDIDRIVQKNQDYYKLQWQKWMQQHDVIVPLKTLSWNWSAFILQECWLLYRKFYMIFAIVFSLRVCFVLVSFFLPFFAFFISPLSMLLYFLLPLLANGFCLNKYMKIYESVKLKYGEDDEKINFYYRSHSSTSLVLPIFFLVFAILATGTLIGYLVSIAQNAGVLS